MPPGRAKVVMTLGRSVTLSWTTPEDDGGCKIGNYIVEYYRLGWNMWLKAATCRQLTTTLGELIEGSEYKFRVKAENPYGVSDPSSESDVVFIPDPKRGLLEPPEHGSAENETAMDVWLEEKKRPISPGLTIDEQYGERKTKRKRGPMAPPQTTPDLGQVDKHSIVSEDSMSPPATPENFQPVIPKRRGKGEKIEVKKEILKDKESVRDQKEKRKMEELKRFDEIKKAEQMRRIEELKRSEELRKPEEPKTPEDSKQNVANIQSELKVKKETQAPQKAPRKEPRTITNEPPKVLKDLNSSHKDTQLPQKDPQKSHTPRVEHDPLHGSSELMLVLLPHSRATTEERETSKRELFESSMAIEGDDIAPPMSLSAPELGNGDPPELPPVRSAFSSTELLHERAMARFYQDMAREEAESSLQRKNSLQRRRSFERRSPPRPKDVPDTAGSLQDIPTSVKTFENTAKRKDTLSPATPSKPSVPELLETSTSQRGYSDKKTFSRDSMDSMLSVEDPHRKSMLVQQASEEDMEYEDSSFDEDEEDYNEEEEEHITDEIVDEEVEEELEEEEEEDEEEFSYDEKRGSLYTSESEEESRYSYSMEEDTYHPSAINKKYNEDTLISAYEGRGPLILGSGSIVSQSVQSTPFQIPTSRSEIKLKPILKQPTADNKFPIKSNETSEYDQSLKVDNEIPKIRTSPEKRFEPNFSAMMPKPILKVRENSQEPNSPLVQRRGVPIAGVEQEINLEPNKTNLDEGSDYETGAKKKQVRIEEPEDVTARESPVIEKVGVPEEFLPTNKTQVSTDEPVRERTGSLGDEGDATMVLVSHYSDIVAEYGRGRRPPKKLYLNYEALKAAAEEEEESAPDVPEVVVNEPEPEPEYEPEPEPEPEPPAPMTEVEQALEEIKTENYLEAYVEDRSEIKLEPVSDTPKKKSPLPAKKRSASPRKPKPPPIPPSVVQDSPPEKIDYIRTPSPELPPRLYTPTEKKVHSYFDFLMDISLFILACWLYIFKDERLSIPVLCLMIYRQANEAFQRKMEALRNKMPRRIRFWRRDE
ncbi:hypothetical protein J6590_031121 [Homalodisca vitripennis]|nr:hypothetical protein J6590_031121 [Homalodisca vitripennis]